MRAYTRQRGTLTCHRETDQIARSGTVMDHRAAKIVSHLFNQASPAINVATVTSLLFVSRARWRWSAHCKRST